MRPSRIFAIAATLCTVSAAATKSGKGFLFTGTNHAGGGFGDAIPGEFGRDYIWPDPKSIDTLMEKGMNASRVGFTMELAIRNKLTGSLNQTYFQILESIVAYITSRQVKHLDGRFAANPYEGRLCCCSSYNYSRHYRAVIIDSKGFGRWSTVAKRFKNNSRVIFDANNEYHDMDTSLSQAAINGICAAGANSQYIFVEGNAWPSSQSWASNGNSAGLRVPRDPQNTQNKLIYEMHLYLDDTSGFSPLCQSSTVGVERLREATRWLRKNGKRGVIGETAAGFHQQCIKAMRGELEYLLDKSDVWTGWLCWAVGPWWQDYMYSMRPPNGIAYEKFLPHIQEFIAVWEYT